MIGSHVISDRQTSDEFSIKLIVEEPYSRKTPLGPVLGKINEAFNEVALKAQLDDTKRLFFQKNGAGTVVVIKDVDEQAIIDALQDKGVKCDPAPSGRPKHYTAALNI